MRFVANGSDVFRLDAGGFFGGSAGHPYMIKEVASSTNPVFTFTSDTNTGIGQAGADTGSLVAGGTNVLNWRGDGHVGVGTTTPEGALHVMQSSTSVPALILSDTGVIDYKYSFPDTNTLKLEVAGAADRTFQLNNSAGGVFNFSLDGDITPTSDNASNLGASDKRWSDVFAVQTTTGGVFETGLKTEKIGNNPTGTIVSWREDGLVPCDKNEDELVMGVIKQGKDEPIVMGAEPVLVTGKVDIGDYIVTSDKIGHGKSVKRGYLLKKNLFGKVIAQALEKSDDSDSCLIKCMIRKM